MQSKATTVEQYLAELPDDRRAALEAIRKVIRKNLDKPIQEGMQYGMIGYFIPHEVYPAGYHCDPKQPLPFAGLASQKNHMSLYMMPCYGASADEAWLQEEWAKTGKKLDMGKCCIRFKKLEDLPLELIGQAFKRFTAASYIAKYEAMYASTKAGKAKAAKAAKTTTAAKSAKTTKKNAKKSAK